MLEKILNYQKLDSQLNKYERNLENDEAKKTVNNMIGYVKTSQNKLHSIEAEAEEQFGVFENLNKEYESCLKTINALVKKDTAKLDEAKVKELADTINQVNNQLNILERKISAYSDIVNNLLKSFEATKNNIVIGKQKYSQSKQVYDGKMAEFTPKIDKIKKELLILEKDIDKNIMAKYKHLKQDNIFPVFVPLSASSCGGCRMEQSSAHIQRLKDKGYMECEQCHRIIYIP